MNTLNIRIARAKGYGNPYVNIPQWDRDIVLAMELMDEIWEKYPDALITKDGVCWNIMLEPFRYIREKREKAICLAWLEIFEKEEK